MAPSPGGRPRRRRRRNRRRRTRHGRRGRRRARRGRGATEEEGGARHPRPLRHLRDRETDGGPDRRPHRDLRARPRGSRPPPGVEARGLRLRSPRGGRDRRGPLRVHGVGGRGHLPCLAHGARRVRRRRGRPRRRPRVGAREPQRRRRRRRSQSRHPRRTRVALRAHDEGRRHALEGSRRRAAVHSRRGGLGVRVDLRRDGRRRPLHAQGTRQGSRQRDRVRRQGGANRVPAGAGPVPRGRIGPRRGRRLPRDRRARRRRPRCPAALGGLGRVVGLERRGAVAGEDANHDRRRRSFQAAGAAEVGVGRRHALGLRPRGAKRGRGAGGARAPTRQDRARHGAGDVRRRRRAGRGRVRLRGGAKRGRVGGRPRGLRAGRPLRDRRGPSRVGHGGRVRRRLVLEGPPPRPDAGIQRARDHRRTRRDRRRRPRGRSGHDGRGKGPGRGGKARPWRDRQLERSPARRLDALRVRLGDPLLPRRNGRGRDVRRGHARPGVPVPLHRLGSGADRGRRRAPRGGGGEDAGGRNSASRRTLARRHRPRRRRGEAGGRRRRAVLVQLLGGEQHDLERHRPRREGARRSAPARPALGDRLRAGFARRELAADREGRRFGRAARGDAHRDPSARHPRAPEVHRRRARRRPQRLSDAHGLEHELEHVGHARRGSLRFLGGRGWLVPPRGEDRPIPARHRRRDDHRGRRERRPDGPRHACEARRSDDRRREWEARSRGQAPLLRHRVGLER